MIPTLQALDAITGRAVDRSNGASLIAGLTAFPAGLDVPHRLAQYLAQIMHESAGLRYDREIASGQAYEGRRDLGNTAPGDGVKFKGRTAIQVTGRANYRAFRDWCDAEGLEPPDFEASPDAILTDPWEGLAPIWFWTSRDLNRYADDGNAEMVTRRINGGLNGYDDRLRYLSRASLVLLGRPADGVRAFQAAAGLKVDGIAGPATRAALHAALKAIPAEPAIAAPLATILATMEARLDAIEARLA